MPTGDQYYVDCQRCPYRDRGHYVAIGNDQALKEVLERIAGALEKLAAVDRGERPDLEPTEDWMRQQRERYEQDTTATWTPSPDDEYTVTCHA